MAFFRPRGGVSFLSPRAVRPYPRTSSLRIAVGKAVEPIAEFKNNEACSRLGSLQRPLASFPFRDVRIARLWGVRLIGLSSRRTWPADSRRRKRTSLPETATRGGLPINMSSSRKFVALLPVVFLSLSSCAHFRGAWRAIASGDDPFVNFMVYGGSLRADVSEGFFLSAPYRL